MSLWGRPESPSCFCTLDLNCEIIDKFIDSYNKKNPNNHITYTHFFMKLMGKSLYKSPSANGAIIFGQFYPYTGVKITTLVAVGKRNLSGVTVHNCQSLTFNEIRDKTNPAIKQIKNDKYEEHNQQMKLTFSLPTFVVSFLLQLASFASYFLRLSIKIFRVKKHSFGTILLTNVSEMKYYNSFAPLVNFTNAIMVTTICKPKDEVVVENDQMVIRKMLKLKITFDHRYADAASIHPTIKEIYRLAENPEDLLSVQN
jgi:pyruvate/2-oxoglutarate dehydrogenase complex dihydrolipoamide acyltransferase (E2) component